MLLFSLYFFLYFVFAGFCFVFNDKFNKEGTELPAKLLASIFWPITLPIQIGIVLTIFIFFTPRKPRNGKVNR